VREDGTGSGVQAVQRLSSYLQKGSLCRTTGSTDMNLTSSRSHAVFSIVLRQEIPDLTQEKEKEATETSDAKPSVPSRKLNSKFHFVDLAGSERVCLSLFVHG
jgi:hypothetical protein